MRTALVLSLLSIGVTAEAACPVQADLEDGIWMSFGDQSFSHYRATVRGTVIHTIYNTDVLHVREIADGLHLLSEYRQKDNEPEPETSKIYSYALTGQRFPPPKAGSRQKIRASVIMSGSEERPNAVPSDWTCYLSYGGISQDTIGKCTYSVLPVQMLYEMSGGTGWTSLVLLLPELGNSLIYATGEQGMPYDKLNWAIDISTEKRQLPK